MLKQWLVSIALFITSFTTSALNTQDYSLTLTVDSPQGLYRAVNQANQRGGHTLIRLSPGIYSLPKTLRIAADHIALVSVSGNPSDTILRGPGMRATKQVVNLIRIEGKHFTFSGLTAEQAPNHIIQIAGERDADSAVIEHCVLQNAYEQILKVSVAPNHNFTADNGIIRHCTFGYPAGTGPQYYIGGIDLHGGKDWLIESNQFYGIASPSKHIAEHAIHIWNGTQHIQVVDNVIVNSDRGIGFGLSKRGNVGGAIRGNIIFHSDNQHRFADAGIILESSPKTRIEGNWVIQYHDYPNAIEYRFDSTQQVVIAANKVNKQIRRRNDGQARLVNNQQAEAIPPLLETIIIERFPSNYRPLIKQALSQK